MIFYPLFVHVLILLEVPVVAVLGLVITSLVYFYTLLQVRQTARTRLGWIGMYAMLATVGVINLLTHTVYALYLPPVFINLGLMFLFAMTLRGRSMPLVERLMRMEYPNGELPKPLISYARNLTRVWVAFFAAIVLISIILAKTAPLEIWSLFTNILSYVFAIVLVLAQYAYRAWRYREHGLFMPWDTLRLMMRISPRDRAQLLFHGRSGSS